MNIPTIPNATWKKVSPGGYKDMPLDFDTQLILAVATRNGIGYEILTGTEIIALTYKGVTRHFYQRRPVSTSSTANKACINKEISKRLMANAGISIPKGYSIDRADNNLEAITAMWESMQKPVVVKPYNTTHGDGVKVGIQDLDSCVAWITHLFEYDHDEKFEVIFEEMFVGSEYRVVVTRNKFLAAMHRIPAQIVGDGVLSIEQLIQKENQQPIRNVSQDVYPHIAIDDDLQTNISKLGFNLASVPAANQTVVLRTVSNVMAGGTAVDVTDTVHESVKELALQAISAIPNLELSGIDFMTKDLTAPQAPDTYCVIEINSAAEFAMHDFPMVGQNRNVSLEFIKLMFPEFAQEFVQP